MLILCYFANNIFSNKLVVLLHIKQVFICCTRMLLIKYKFSYKEKINLFTLSSYHFDEIVISTKFSLYR